MVVQTHRPNPIITLGGSLLILPHARYPYYPTFSWGAASLASGAALLLALAASRELDADRHRISPVPNAGQT